MCSTAGLRGSPGYLPATFLFSALLLADPGPAAAQTDLLMVVCVGSELEDVMGANQVPQTFRRDEEMGYITDVDPAYREEAEQAVREHLAGYTRVWCEWSGPGDSHVVVVRFAAVFRRDETVDPGDPRFTNYAVGFGKSWDEAEARATSLNERFTTFTDGTDYGRMLQLRWGEVEEDADRPEIPRPEPAGLFRDCGACPGMVVVPAGTFPMGAPDSEAGRSGSEGPLRPVTIGAPFAVGAYEVTFAEWDACVLAGGCDGIEPDDLGLGRERRPVINVTWDEVQAYLAWLSAETGHRYRLLSEAEWEYAARAGTEGMRYWGEGEPRQCEHANAQDAAYLRESPSQTAASCSDGYAKTAPVGLYAPNAFGLHDVLGNVAPGRRGTAPCAWCAAAPGEPRRTRCAWRPACRGRPTTDKTPSGSGLPGT
ncbi:MAG: formylglycine-generating enzyme family protein [Gemmatimonadetes bacterium]|nr:formylglycine-generating enzyme family protein [Gemmatimonadota bacterium]MYE71024.1 formylglycine-generating enzyme family protein [Gemmatimonadota bacterium]MYJ69608.1 formylglycine-generating enzyme family protein [Gemmatimonadota bacterium]